MTEQEIDIREALRQAMDEELARDPSVFLMGEEVAQYNGAYKISKGLWEKYGDKRVIDTPISEAGFSGIGIGAALTGLRPIIEFMSFNFSLVAFDQIVNNALKMHYMSGGRFRCPIVFRGPNGAAASVSCQHSLNVEPLYAHLPGCIVLSPSTPYDAKGLLKSAIRNDNPILFLENELMYGIKGQVPTDDYTVPIGKAHIAREGSDVTLISYSRMMVFCHEVCDILQKRNISVELIDLRTIKPLDMGTIAQSVRKTNRVVTVEEGHIYAGVCSELIARIQTHCFDYLDAPVGRVCQKETPLPYSPVMEKESMPNTNSILKEVENVLR